MEIVERQHLLLAETEGRKRFEVLGGGLQPQPLLEIDPVPSSSAVENCVLEEIAGRNAPAATVNFAGSSP